MQSRRDFLKRMSALGISAPLLGGLVGTSADRAAGSPSAPEGSNRPNILFVFTDQQTSRSLSAAGNPYVDTPAMDSLAADGVRFEASYCTTPVCGPARSSLITGMMPHTTGLRFNPRFHPDIAENGLLPDSPTLGELFRQAGYETVYGGKWHLPKTPAETGFEKILYGADSRGQNMDPPLAEACSDYLRSYAESPSKPFLMVASFVNPHDICYWAMGKDQVEEPEESAGLPPLPVNFEINPNEPEFLTMRRNRQQGYGRELRYSHDWSGEHWRRYIHAYYRYTEMVDSAIGKLLDTLRETALDENTLVIFTSDHGDGVGAHRWVVKLNLYEGPASVPLIISWKGHTPAGQVDREHPVTGIDLLPTMCDYAGIRVPPDVQGSSLRPLIEDPNAGWRGFAVTELINNPDNLAEKGRMLRTRNYKYTVHSIGENREQLFDLRHDPGEMYNLAGQPEARAILYHHRELLKEWIRKTDDDFTPMPGKNDFNQYSLPMPDRPQLSPV